jgi:hypothetical protein
LTDDLDRQKSDDRGANVRAAGGGAIRGLLVVFERFGQAQGHG